MPNTLLFNVIDRFPATPLYHYQAWGSRPCFCFTIPLGLRLPFVWDLAFKKFFGSALSTIQDCSGKLRGSSKTRNFSFSLFPFPIVSPFFHSTDKTARWFLDFFPGSSSSFCAQDLGHLYNSSIERLATSTRACVGQANGAGFHFACFLGFDRRSSRRWLFRSCTIRKKLEDLCLRPVCHFKAAGTELEQVCNHSQDFLFSSKTTQKKNEEPLFCYRSFPTVPHLRDIFPRTEERFVRRTLRNLLSTIDDALWLHLAILIYTHDIIGFACRTP